MREGEWDSVRLVSGARQMAQLAPQPQDEDNLDRT